MTSSTPASPAVRRFRFRLGPTLTTLVGVLVLVGLGTWQLQRLAWKENLIRVAEAGLAAPAIDLPAGADLAGLEFRHVTARGMYLHDAAVGFGLAAVGGLPGGRLLTPMRLEDGRVILVDRGWLPEPLLPPRTPAEMQPAGPVSINGVARWRGGLAPGWMAPANEPDKRRWFTWDIPAMEQTLGLALVPLTIVLERPDGSADLPKTEAVTIDLPNNHFGYALTWYGLAVALAAIYVLSSFSKPDAPQP